MPMPARTITVNGTTKTIEEWAKAIGVSVETLRCRLDKLMWPPERAVTTPADRRFRRGGRPRADSARPCPPLKKHKTTGQAYCRWETLGRRRWVSFGPWGSAEAKAAHARFVLEWAAGAHTTPKPEPAAGGIGVAEVVKAWLDWCALEYVKNGKPTSETACCRAAVVPLVELYGEEPAAEFGPVKLTAVVGAMVAREWARGSINLHRTRIVRCFKWAASRELIPVATYTALTTVGGLKRGRTKAPEPERVGVAPDADVDATIPKLSAHPGRAGAIAAMIQVQRLTGMRPGEVCALEAAAIDRTGAVWVYTVGVTDKTFHRGGPPRRYFFGPKVQALLAPFLAAAPAGRRLIGFRMKSGRWVTFTVNTYSCAVRLACRRAGVKGWHPHQLRHSLATAVAERMGVEKAAAAIGDTPETAARVYVHADPRDRARREIALEMG